MSNKGFFNLLCHHDYGEVVGVWNFGRRDLLSIIYYIINIIFYYFVKPYIYQPFKDINEHLILN
jgi:hypothetical protein